MIELAIGLEESRRFARLCGDSNPLHVDPVAARRTQFGSTVVHGIHLVMAALDRLAAQRSFAGLEPAAIAATFSNPVLSGTPVSVRIVDGEKIKLTGEAAGRPAFSVTLQLQPCAGAVAAPEDADFPPEHPRELGFPPPSATGTVPLKLSEALTRELFPHLPPAAWMADLLATTNIVGMRCPGLDSIYSAFKLKRTTQAHSAGMRYAVDRVDERFRLVRMQVAGAALEGSIETFFRPKPVRQPLLADIVPLVAPEAFAMQRALVVGGSRGLGELTAKILAAGSASVTITYARGADDAQRVCAEARRLSRACEAKHLDVLDMKADWLAGSRFTHVYFFASPQISRNPTPRWNHALFELFAQVYVRAFATLVERVTAGRDDAPHFLYPSSVFVTQPEPGFAEYAVAKASGEALCEHLRGARFTKPRLPRMRTDQTNSLIDSGAQDPLPVMLEVLRGMQS
jgi:hypothetical protein